MDKKDIVWGTEDGTMTGQRVLPPNIAMARRILELEKEIESLQKERDEWIY